MSAVAEHASRRDEAAAIAHYARFGKVVRQRREELRWSQEELAHQAEVNRSFVGEIERGTAVPSLATMAKLAVALEIKLSALLARCEQHFTD